MHIIKPVGAVLSLTTANNFSNVSLVYLAAVSTCEITLANSTGGVLGTFVLPASQYLLVEKENTDTLASNVAVYATPTAYKG